MKKFWNWARDETAPDARVLRLREHRRGKAGLTTT